MADLTHDPLPKKLLLIVNPVSGKKAIVRHIPAMLKAYQDAGYLCTAMVTGQPGDATRFVMQYGAGQDKIVCTGGDGTLNETVSGLMKAGLKIPVGFIPCGSTNVFAEYNHVPAEIPAAVQCSIDGECREYDLGRFEENYFTFIAAFGAFTDLSYTTDQNLKNALGKTAYFLESVKDIKNIHAVPMRFITENDTYEGEYLFGAICNSTSVGGVFRLPETEVDPHDGKFELFLIRKPTSIIELNAVALGLLQQDYSSPYITLAHCGKIEIDNPTGERFSLDGEGSKACPSIHISVIPNAFQTFSEA